MNIETFLLFLMKHNATIIEVLVGVTLLAILFLAVRSFLYAKDEPVQSGSSMAELEVSLKKILEKANQVPAAATGQVDPSLLAEIAKLKGELEVKQKKIEELSALSAQGAAAGATAQDAGGPTLSIDEREKLEAQIKELQAKLSEYEIISEDIADLSFYKEQNARLQKELEAKGAMLPPADAPAAAPATPAIDPVAESVSALTAQTAAPSATVEEPVSAATPAVSAAAPAPPSVENTVDTDLMAEFDAAVEKQKVAAADEADLGALNMDKMLAEAAEIKTDVPDMKAEDVLNQSLDENKLLQEADAMKKEVGNPEDEKLMGQFENFVKKGDA